MKNDFETKKREFRVGQKTFFQGTHIMGILNLTPDSFFEGSRVKVDEIAIRAAKMIEQGAEILDIGGQTTKPGCKIISAAEELDRVGTAVEILKRTFPSTPLSVDTFYGEVSHAVLAAGADMINDVNCLKDVTIAAAVAKHSASICIMHNRRETVEPDMWEDKISGLASAAELCKSCGIPHERILLDGGVGFNKTLDEDRELLDGYGKLRALGYPLLLGTSRKRLFGGEPKDRLAATVDSTRFAEKTGILFVRVHDVAENFAALRGRV
jgi:dihydropteroate synthase